MGSQVGRNVEMQQQIRRGNGVCCCSHERSPRKLGWGPMKLAWVQTPHGGSGAADFNGTREERIGASLCPNGVLYLLPSHLMSCRSRWASLAFACLSRVCTCDGARGCQPLTTANCRLGEPQLIVSSGCFYKALILIRYRCTQAFRKRTISSVRRQRRGMADG